MAKKQQMRWTDEGAHYMVQVRVAVLNGELSPRRICALDVAASRHGKCIGGSTAGPPPTNEQIRLYNHAVSQGALTKPTSPTFARSPNSQSKVWRADGDRPRNIKVRAP
jgi:hypothetical protein